MSPVTYLIAEDEPFLAAEFASHLAQLWPEAQCVGVAGNGDEALTQCEEKKPDVVFLDVRMPGRDGLQVAHALCDRADEAPLMVFVTAYDQYALAAFDAAALDYLLKPVERERLAVCIARLRAKLQQDGRPPLDMLAEQLKQVLGRNAAGATQGLRFIRAGSGNSVRMIPVEEVVFFEARDKYVSVVTPDGESLIRSALRDLVDDLDPNQFWQVHRSIIVNAKAITSAERDAFGRFRLNMRGRPERLVVSRQFAHRFKPM